MLRVSVRTAKAARTYELPIDEAVLGAGRGADLHAPFAGISRRHAIVRTEGRSLVVVDAGSKNGLVRDGERLAQVILQPGESIRIGRATLTLEEISSSDAALAVEFTPAPRLAADESSDTPVTDSLWDGTGGGSPAAALAWARMQSRLEQGSSTSADSFDAARAALGAEKLVWAAPAGRGEESVTVLASAGPLPDEGELLEFLTARPLGRAPSQISSTKRGASPELESGPILVTEIEHRQAIVWSDGKGSGARILAAILPPSTLRPSAWQLDFVEFLGGSMATSTLTAPLSVRPQRLATQEGEALVFPEGALRGSSPAIVHLLDQVRATVRSNLDVLLLGETGTGKELFARMVHASGPTPKGPFVAINCAAIPAELLEAQLFGVEGRIATGVDPHVGLFVKAEGGSIFLDEIGELPPALQAKLLRVLQEREVLALGAHVPRKVRLRVISASNKVLEQEVEAGRFRADLFYRLRGLRFHLPPLRDRREDIPAFVSNFVEEAAREHDKHIPGVSRKALDLLSAYDWPGNIRELRYEIVRAVLVANDGSPLTSEHFGSVRWQLEHEQTRMRDTCLAAESAQSSTAETRRELIEPLKSEDHTLDLASARDQLERRLIAEALRTTGGNQSRAAKLLGITRNGLAMKVRRLGIE
jgi:DNA-binding NtrC family response regulator